MPWLWEDTPSLNPFLCRGSLDQDSTAFDTDRSAQLSSSAPRSTHVGRSDPTWIIWCAFSTVALVSEESLASTSVDTFPGTISRISVPDSTSKRSRVASACSSTSLPWWIGLSDHEMSEPVDNSQEPNLRFFCRTLTPISTDFAYSGFFEAARIRDGFVVASCGLYLAIAVGTGQAFIKAETEPSGTYL